MSKYLDSTSRRIVLIVSVTIIAVVGYVLIGNNRPKMIGPINWLDTGNWKTYTNKDLGFEIKYPPLGSRQDIEVTSDSNSGTVIYFNDWSESDPYAGMFAIGISTTTPGMRLSDWVEKNIDFNSGILMKNNNFKFSTYNGMEVARFVGNIPLEFGSPVGINYVIKSPTRNFVYTLSVDGQSNDLDKYGLKYGSDVGSYDKFMEAVLSTFKAI